MTSHKLGEGRPLGTILVMGLAGCWRRFFTSVGMGGGWVPSNRVYSVVIIIIINM